MRVGWQRTIEALIVIFVPSYGLAMYFALTFTKASPAALACSMVPLGAALLAGFVLTFCRICSERPDDAESKLLNL